MAQPFDIVRASARGSAFLADGRHEKAHGTSELTPADLLLYLTDWLLLLEGTIVPAVEKRPVHKGGYHRKLFQALTSESPDRSRSRYVVSLTYI